MLVSRDGRGSFGREGTNQLSEGWDKCSEQRNDHKSDHDHSNNHRYEDNPPCVAFVIVDGKDGRERGTRSRGRGGRANGSLFATLLV